MKYFNRPARAVVSAVAALLLAATGASAAGSVTSHAATRGPHGTELDTRVAPTGYYGAPAIRPDGHIDIAQTLNAVRSHGAHYYQYLIANRWGYNSANDWADLPAFLAAAKRWNVTVMVILLPPTENSMVKKGRNTCKSELYPPYYKDYDKWFTEIGKLAKIYPALTGSGMDDFVYSFTGRPSHYCSTFGPKSAWRWQIIQNRNAGRKLIFAPTMYWPDLGPGDMHNFDKLNGTITDVVYAFPEVRSEKAITQRVAYIMKRYPKLRIHVMIYASPVKNRFEPTAATVDLGVKIALACKPASVVVYLQRMSWAPKKK